MCPNCSELSSLGTRCSTSAGTRVAKKRAVRTTDPPHCLNGVEGPPPGDFAHFHHPLRAAVSTPRRTPLATTSYVRVMSPPSTTNPTRSPFTGSIPLIRRPVGITDSPKQLCSPIP